MKKRHELKLIKDIICMMQQKAMKDYGDKQRKRSAHTKALAILKGELVIKEDIPMPLKEGLFKVPNTYPVWIRISNSSNKPKKDSRKDVRGFAIKCMYEGQPQDFILVSTKHMPLRSVKGFHAAVSLMNGRRPLHSFVQLIKDMNFTQLLNLALEMKHETSPLDIPYFSITPFALGAYGVKYSLIPASTYKSVKPKKLSPTYLRDNMKKHLANDEAIFHLMVQPKTKGLSIEDTSEVWDESISPMIQVATLRIPLQVFDTVERKTYGETLTFSPAHALEAHRPLGSLNRARAMIYREMQVFRKENT